MSQRDALAAAPAEQRVALCRGRADVQGAQDDDQHTVHWGAGHNANRIDRRCRVAVELVEAMNKDLRTYIRLNKKLQANALAWIKTIRVMHQNKIYTPEEVKERIKNWEGHLNRLKKEAAAAEQGKTQVLNVIETLKVAVELDVITAKRAAEMSKVWKEQLKEVERKHLH